jgi:hypothetical protein
MTRILSESGVFAAEKLQSTIARDAEDVPDDMRAMQSAAGK